MWMWMWMDMSKREGLSTGTGMAPFVSLAMFVFLVFGARSILNHCERDLSRFPSSFLCPILLLRPLLHHGPPVSAWMV